jgi:kynurenine formamidase
MSKSSALLADLAAGIVSGGIRVVDLTVPLEPLTPTIQLPPQFAPSKPFSMEEISKYDQRGPAWYWNNIACGEHTGTHFDAPIHWISGKDLSDSSVDRIPPRQFIGPACVLDVAHLASRNPDHLVLPADILKWEVEHGRIPAGSWVLLRTGWSRRKGPDYINLKDNGPHTPGFTKESSTFLAKERDVLGVGVETVGTDAGQAAKFDPPFPNHYIMHGSGKFGLAGLTNLDQLPITGAIVIAAPLKIVNGSGSPVRVIALVQNS